MRGRIGGRIGTSSPPSSYGASGVWAMADVYATLRGSYGADPFGLGPAWPTNTVSISWPSDWYSTFDFIDATATGEGTFSPEVQSTYPSLSYSWERSTNGGTTWATVSGQTGATLTLTGQTTANDEDKYRLVADAGIRKFYGPAGSVRFEPGFSHPLTLAWPLGLTDGGGSFGNSLTRAAGASFSYYAQSYFVRAKYGGDPIMPSSIIIQSSADGGTTWQTETPDFVGAEYSYKEYAASAGDNGRKWRGVATFLGQTYTSPVATLTVT